MIYNSKYIFLLIFPLVFGIFAATIPLMPISYAQSNVADVFIAKGSGSNQNCVQANNCLDPSTVRISSGMTVSWYNSDSINHQIVSGSPFDNSASKMFDSNVIVPASGYGYTFTDNGTFPFYDNLHQWITGVVIVGNGLPPKPFQIPTNVAVSVSTDQPSYPLGSYVVISGDVKNISDNTQLDVSILDSNKNQVSDTLAYIMKGSFVLRPMIPVSGQPGIYTVQVRYHNQIVSQTTFAVTSLSQSSSGPSNPNANSTTVYKLLHTNSSSTTNTPILTPTSTPSKIPSWVRHIFIFYGQGDVSEDELLNAIKFLLQQGILKVQ